MNSVPIWLNRPDASVEVAAGKSIRLDFTVRARPEAEFAFSFRNTDGVTFKINSSGANHSIDIIILLFLFFLITAI